MWEDENKTPFELVGQSPHMWLSSARQLKTAADLVAVELRQIVSVYPEGRASYHDLVLFNPFMLLNGLAIENLAKGILVGRHPEKVSSDKFGLKGHNLAYFAKEVNISYSSAELDLFERLHKFVVWAGRYPIPLKATELDSPSFRFSDFDGVTNLFQRLADLLESENPKPTIQFA